MDGSKDKLIDAVDNESGDINLRQSESLNEESGDINDNEFESHESLNVEGSRTHKMTEKGLSWHLQVLHGKFRTSATVWKKQANKCLIQLSDCDDCQTLRLSREDLDQCFSVLTDITYEFNSLGDEDVSGLIDKFEVIENEHLKIMSHISDTVRSLETDKSSSRSSKRSSSSRSGATKISVAAEAASLRAKLKFIDSEAKLKADLERLETMKQLEMATAKAEVYDSLDPFTTGITLSDVKQLPQDDMNNYVSEYVRSHSFPDAKYQSVAQPTSISVQNVVRTQDHIVSGSYGTRDATVDAVHDVMPTTTSCSLNPLVSAFQPTVSDGVSGRNHVTFDQLPPRTESLQSINLGLIDLVKTLADQVALNRLPPPEPSVFNGDPIQYPSWKTAFKTLVDQRNIPAAERIHYLKRYLGGSVKQVVETFFLLPSDVAYEEAKKLLEERYGDPFVVASAFRDKLEAWPRIQSKDSPALLKFADFLRQCLTAMKTIPCLEILNDCRENRKLLSKVPEWVVVRWNRVVAGVREKTHAFPSFKVFTEFIYKEAQIACDPVTSLQSFKDMPSSESRNVSGPKSQKGSGDGVKPFGSRSFFSDSNENRSETSSTTSCFLCKEVHDLDDCKIFFGKTLSARKLFAKDNGLCFGCLRKGHISRKCRQRKTCKTCKKLHPTSLHGDKGDSSVTVAAANDSADTKVKLGTSFLSYTGAESKCSAIVPVYVSHSSDPDEERLVYALLDSQSDTTFILQDTCEALGLSGTPVKLSLSTMLLEDKVVSSQKVKGLSVRGYNSLQKIPLPDAYTRNIMPANRSHIPTADVANAWSHLEHIAPKLLPLSSCEIGLLIGYNCSQALLPREVIPPDADGPFGLRTDLGWSIVGIVKQGCNEEDSIGLSHRVLTHEVPSELLVGENNCAHSVLFSLRTSVKEIVSNDVLQLIERDFSDIEVGTTSLSVEDRHFLSTLSQGTCLREGKYEMPLPFKHRNPVLPNNRYMAISRLKSLQRHLQRDERFRQHYTTFMGDLLKKGHAERVKENDLNSGTIWYIPHHGVYHPQKPDKIRVVFDCSATFQGHSLNQHLLQGPDLTNKLVGVLCRFRKESVAVMCDIEQMFYQFRVSSSCKDYLRFLWWDSDDYSLEPVDFRMTVHLFGATSSPGCANFGLRQLANDNELEFGSDISKFIHRDFYVDDGLKSLPTVQQAVDLIGRTKSMCSKAGIRLHKFVSNSKEVIHSVHPDDRAKDLKNIDMVRDKLPVERTLGILWCIESDTFQFKITLKDRPLTRRGILSAVSCLYDPLGLIGPVVLLGKQVLQQMCADKADWDDPLPECLRSRWRQWCESLNDLSSLKTRRCLKPDDFGEVSAVELHHFSDASTVGYGQCSYVRLINRDNKIHCALLMGKSRVVPLRPITIPRLELVAAVLSVKTGNLLQQELDYDDVTHFYWSDSKVVLGYIANESRRFHVFVANRVQQIREHSEPSQWNYVVTSENPADIASRGIKVKDFVNKSIWFDGPDFLWCPELPNSPEECVVDSGDSELRKVCMLVDRTVVSNFPSLLERLQYFSNWYKAKRALGLCLRFRKRLIDRAVKKPKSGLHRSSCRTVEPLSVAEMQVAELVMCKLSQREEFKVDINRLQECRVIGIPEDRDEVSRRHVALKSNSRMRQLDPFLDSNGVLRVGGRIRNSNIDESLKHPIVMPSKGHLTELLVRHFHEKTLHQGRGITTNEIRQNGFWVVGCSSAVSSILSKCIVCRRLRAFAQEQKMSDLPVDRLEPAPPFTYCAVDFFGPFYIKEGRKELKRYGVLFTCMACRAVHVETANSLDTGSFINALRRFIAIRGPIRQLRSDRGTNFVGAEHELSKALNELDEDRIRNFLSDCDFFSFKMNVPCASHMGGVWERQIRSVRSVLSYLLLNHGTQLDDECLRTFLYEAAAIVNCRPLTVNNLNDPLSLIPLSANQLLTMKLKVILPPPGRFQKEDVYSRKRWRRTQYLVEQFWSRWKVEFLQNLQLRNKWFSPKRNLCIGDVVILVDNNMPRNTWKLGRVYKTIVDDDGLVRKVNVELADSDCDNLGKRDKPLRTLERPVQKLILLQESEVIPV